MVMKCFTLEIVTSSTSSGMEPDASSWLVFL